MKIWRWTQYVDDERLYSFDLSDIPTEQSTTITSVTAESNGDVDCTISNASVSSNVWSGDVLTEKPGCCVVRLTVVLANGRQRVRKFEIRVKDASCHQVNGGVGKVFNINSG